MRGHRSGRSEKAIGRSCCRERHLSAEGGDRGFSGRARGGVSSGIEGGVGGGGWGDRGRAEREGGVEGTLELQDVNPHPACRQTRQTNSTRPQQIL